MSSFFDSLNFHNINHASSSSQRLDSTPGQSSSPRKRRSIYRPLSSRTSSLSPTKKGTQITAPTPPSQSSVPTTARAASSSSAHNDDNEGIQVYWNCPPSSLMGDWGKSMVESAKAKRLGGLAEGDGDVEPTATNGNADEDSIMHSRWTRQDSRASNTSSTSAATSTSTSTASISSTTRRTTKALRRIKGQQPLPPSSPSSPFRRHASSYAALGSNEAAKKDATKVKGVISGGMQQLLADLSIRVQEIDRQVEVDDDDHEEADVTIGAAATGGSGSASSSGGTGTVAATATATPSSGTVTSTGHQLSSQPPRSSANWERSVTFPPTGSPATTKSRASAAAAAAAAIDVDETEDNAEDSFGDDFDFDEEFLRDIELSQQQQQEAALPEILGQPPPQVEISTASLLGKRRCPPSPPASSSSLSPNPTSKESDEPRASAISSQAVEASTFYGRSTPSLPPSSAAPSASARSMSIGHFVEDEEEISPVRTSNTAAASATGSDSLRSRSHSPAKISSTATRGTTPSVGGARLGTRANSSAASYPSANSNKATQMQNNHRSAAAAPPVRTRSAGLPRQQAHSRPPLSANIQNKTQGIHRINVSSGNGRTSSAFKPPSRVVAPPDTDDTDFEGLLDDSELEKALTAAGY